MNVSILSTYGLPVWQAITDSFISNILLAACGMLVLNNMRYYLPGKEKYWYVLALALALSCAWLTVSRSILWLCLRHYPGYLEFLHRSSAIRYSVAFLVISCIEAMGLLWYTQQERNENEDREKEISRIAKEAELSKLRQQLQPHFLFNSLNSISALTGSQPEKARHMIQQLSDFLRGTLRKEDNHWNNLTEELEYLQLYLDIEKVRFGQRLQTTITIDQLSTSNVYINEENKHVCICLYKFGLYDTMGEVNISINATKEKDQLIINISNPFDAETAGNLGGTGFGLSSISRRLYLLFARNDLLRTEANERTFITTIIIPQIVK